MSFNSYLLTAQVFDSEQNPPGIKWMQINTQNFQILYPSELKREANRMANTMEYLIEKVSKSLDSKPRKITVILQNQAVISNGFVQLAPRRSEFFATPPQNFDTQDWLNSLAVHELRHVVQIDKLSGNLKAPFFEELALAIFGVTLPPWFFEGDAVGIETALTDAGRGRLPDWELIFRTNTLSKNYYSYSKNYFGSFKTYTPGYYQLGYFMTGKLKRDYGRGIIDSIMTRISKNPLRPYNFSRSVKKFTGMNTRILHDSTVSELSRLWETQKAQAAQTDYPALHQRRNDIPADFLFPVQTGHGELIALEKSFDKTPVIVRINNAGRKSDLIKIGHQTESNLNYSAGRVVWDEFRYDPRYHKRSFNVINIYDLNSGSYKQLTRRSRLFSPALSPDAKTIAAVLVDLSNEIRLTEIDAETGKTLRVFDNPGKYILQTPSYSPDGTRIVCVAINKDGAGLLEFYRADGRSRVLLQAQRQQLSRPVYAMERVLVRAGYNGINNIYSVLPGQQANQTPEIRQLTNAVYGASNPSYNQESGLMTFNIFQNTGYDIASLQLDQIAAVPLKEVSNSFINYAAPLAKQEAGPISFDSVPGNLYPERPYRQFKNLFYFHSLSPIAEENEFSNDLNFGIKLKSNNQLNTLDFYTGYQFNSGLKKSEYLAGLTYKQFYPLFDLRYINRARLAYSSRTTGSTTTLVPVNWRENFAEIGVRLPFTANRLNKTYSMGVTALTSFTSRYEVTNRPARFAEKITFPINYQYYFSHNTQRSLRDLAPKWGQNITLSYQHLPFQPGLKGNHFRIQTLFFSPGIVNNHSLQTSFNYQKSNGIYNFNVDIPRASGYNSLKPGYVRNTLLFDYRLPLFYPDAEIGPVAYIKRLRAGLFADFENVGKGNSFEPRTYGLEINADMNFLRFYLPDFAVSGKLIFVNETRPTRSLMEFGFTYGF
ncbi:MAG: TolB family protein [Daejeonella sp.]|uniref:hypothetical protein n=1 Tax=Daejeonella sp. JGW-45 TaxID=3034148 RepID=UPI0023EAF782|nr:hypothetical protein [Daejeonella sp. JGW-45]